MLKIKHLAHPLRTARVAKLRLGEHFQIRRFAAQSDARFRGDSRYKLHYVTKGFAPRLNDSSDDSEILRRICVAYARTVADQRLEPPWYEATEWWKEIRRSSLADVIRALENGDTNALQAMYRNFFRDPCVAGLVGVPFGMWKAYFHRQMKDLHRRAYLGDSLYRLDYWNSRTSGRFDLTDLAGPSVGNPYGVLLNGTLVRHSAEYHHFCAHEVLKLNSSRGVVAEIGGGYGALAYYLLRDGDKLTYVNFDVPESIALASYYLLKAFPSMKFTLYGERALTEETIATSDAVLLPAFAMQKIPARAVNVTFASHVLGDLAPSGLAAYMNFVSQSTQDHFVYFGGEVVVASISRLLEQSDRACAPPRLRTSEWNRHKAPEVREVEVTYGFTGK